MLFCLSQIAPDFQQNAICEIVRLRVYYSEPVLQKRRAEKTCKGMEARKSFQTTCFLVFEDCGDRGSDPAEDTARRFEMAGNSYHDLRDRGSDPAEDTASMLPTPLFNKHVPT